MYNEIYTIPFKSIDENSYVVIIEKDGFTGTSTELTGSTSPFTVETSLDNPISPYRLSTATLKIFGGDYLQNLFTSNPQGVRVKLLKNGIVEWIGFVTNDTYSQDYSNIEFEYEIELVNPLSTLKHKKFIYTTDTITFYQLIIDSIKATNSEIKKLYLPSSITNELNENIYELISTASSNYIDEQDKEMNYYEILEEIAKYLGLTITIDKDIVYFLDYIGISKGYNQYYDYTFDTNYTVTKNPSKVNLSNSNTIQLLDYSGDSSTLQINSGKNKAKVVCSLYDIENLLPEFDDEGSVFVKMTEDTSTVSDITYKEIRRYYKTDKFDMFKFTNSSDSGTLHNEVLENWQLGSQFIRSAEYDVANIPSKLSFNNELLVKRFDISYGALNNTKPIIKLTSKKKIITHTNMYLCIAVEVKVNGILYNKNTAKELIEKAESDTTVNMYAKLKIGNSYWNGTTWTTSDSRFTMPITVKKGNQFNEVYLSLDNTNTFDKGIGDLEGYTFKAPDQIAIGKIELTLYSFDGISTLFPTGNVIDRYLRYRNIEVRYGIPNSQTVYGDFIDKESNNDAVYENTIDDAYVEEAEEIELKICTFPDDYTKLCYSTTIINNVFLKTIKYIPLNITDKPENIIINKVVDYYKNPKFQVSIPIINKPLYPYTLITDLNLTGKTFIYAGNEIDYEFEKNVINLIEI